MRAVERGIISLMESYQSQEVNVIVGAGVTGLTTAYLLTREGKKCIILEKNKEIGGCCHSFKLDDIIFDLGPHFFFYNPDFEAERFMMYLLEEEKIIKKRFRFSIFQNNKHWKFPIGLIDMLLYPMEYKLQLLKRLFTKRKKGDIDAVDAKHEMVKKIGITYYNKTIAPMLKSKALLPGSQIHRDWLRRVDRNINNEKEPFLPIPPLKHIWITIQQVLYQAYLYPAKGYDIFTQKLWEKFNSLNGETVLDCGKITIKTDKNLISKVVVNDKEYLTKNVIWTGSVNELNDAIGSNAPKIKYVKVIIVFLSYNQKKRIRRPYGYLYYPDKNLIFNRVYYPSSIFGRQSPDNREGICFELNYLDKLDSLTDKEIIDHTIIDADKLGLFKKEQLRQSKVLDYENKIKETFKDVHRCRNLYSIGRLGGYYFCMTPAAVNQGIKMARHLLQKQSNVL
jgi:protoporphyrinogen oxidase